MRYVAHNHLARIALVATATVALTGCAQAAAPVAETPASPSETPQITAYTPSAPETYDVPVAQSVLGESSWGNLFATLGSEAVAFGQRVQGELPTAAFVQWSGVGGGEPLELRNPAEVRALFNALAGASLGGEVQEVTTDDYTSFGFTFANGERFSVSFDSLALVLNEGGRYKAYSVNASDDFYRFADLARQKTLTSY